MPRAALGFCSQIPTPAGTPRSPGLHPGVSPSLRATPLQALPSSLRCPWSRRGCLLSRPQPVYPVSAPTRPQDGPSRDPVTSVPCRCAQEVPPRTLTAPRVAPTTPFPAASPTPPGLILPRLRALSTLSRREGRGSVHQPGLWTLTVPPPAPPSPPRPHLHEGTISRCHLSPTRATLRQKPGSPFGSQCSLSSVNTS